jgi:hypothetical protein
MLTANECRVAAERARKYPKGFGDVFLALEQAPDVRFGDSVAAAYWLKTRPEDVEKGCPAVAVATVRGDLSEDGLIDAFYDLLGAIVDHLKYNNYVTTLHEDPSTVATWLDELAILLDHKEKEKSHASHSE